LRKRPCSCHKLNWVQFLPYLPNPGPTHILFRHCFDIISSFWKWPQPLDCLFLHICFLPLSQSTGSSHNDWPFPRRFWRAIGRNHSARLPEFRYTFLVPPLPSVAMGSSEKTQGSIGKCRNWFVFIFGSSSIPPFLFG
jgi:hypothetical protein